MEGRQNILFFSPNVESILMILNGRVMTCNVPHLGYDEETDPDFKKPLLIGALGSQCLKTIPCSFRTSDIASDCLFLGPEFAGSEEFLSGKVVPPECFQDHATPQANALHRPAAGDPKVFRFPRCFPKLVGVPIVEGSLSSHEVIQSLADYSPIAEAWALMHKCILLDPTYRIKEKTIKTLCLDSFPVCPNAKPKSFQTEIIANPFPVSAMRTAVEARVSSVIDRNVLLFKKENPDLFEKKRVPRSLDLVRLSGRFFEWLVLVRCRQGEWQGFKNIIHDFSTRLLKLCYSSNSTTHM